MLKTIEKEREVSIQWKGTQKKNMPWRWGRLASFNLSWKEEETWNLSTLHAHTLPAYSSRTLHFFSFLQPNLLEPTRTILSPLLNFLSIFTNQSNPIQHISVMAEEGSGAVTVYNSSAISDSKHANPFSIKVGLAQLLRGGAIVEVSTLHQAKLAEEAGACSVVVSEPRSVDGRITRMLDPSLIKEIKRAVSIPVIARSRVGHFVEAQILEALDLDYIDESEALAIADEDHFINKHNFRTPFICGSRNLGEAFRRIREGAAMIRTQGDLRGGNVAATVRSVRSVMGEIRVLNNMDDDEVFGFAKRIGAPYDLVVQAKQMGRLPVVLFASGGIETAADAALMMQLGCDGVFVGAELFDCPDPYKRIRGIVQAVRHYSDPQMLAEASCEMEDGMMAGNQDRIEDQTV